MALVYKNALVNLTSHLDLPTSIRNTKSCIDLSLLWTYFITRMPKQQVEPPNNWNQINSFKYLPCILVEKETKENQNKLKPSNATSSSNCRNKGVPFISLSTSKNNLYGYILFNHVQWMWMGISTRRDVHKDSKGD